MAGFQLTASANPLFATTATETKSTTIKYEAPEPISLWRRVSAGTWTTENRMRFDRKRSEVLSRYERALREWQTYRIALEKDAEGRR